MRYIHRALIRAQCDGQTFAGTLLLDQEFGLALEVAFLEENTDIVVTGKVNHALVRSGNCNDSKNKEDCRDEHVECVADRGERI